MNGAEEQILKEIRDVKETVNGNALTAARIEGKLEVHAIQIERNQKDIGKNEKSIGKLDNKLSGLALKVATAATAAGAAAGSAVMAIANTLKGGG